MLVNLTPNKTEIARRIQLAKDNDFEYIPQSNPCWLQETGIYQSSFPFNFPLEEFVEFESFLPGRNHFDIFPDYSKDEYGVADNIDQIKEYYKEEIADPDRKFVLALTPVYPDPENRGKGGGWRWHKWGSYIGELNPQCEYLDDEDFGEDFKYVICFVLYEIHVHNWVDRSSFGDERLHEQCTKCGEDRWV